MNTNIELDVLDVDEKKVRAKYETITKKLIEKKLMITTMESCTSGQIASLITDTEGSSAVMKGSEITYSNEAKVLAGVSPEVIDKYGVYSIESAVEMAISVREKFKADIALGVTGTFGNVDPNNADSVPGKVFAAIIKKTESANNENKASEENTQRLTIAIKGSGSRYLYKLAVADAIADYLI